MKEHWWLKVSVIEDVWVRRLAIVVTFPIALVLLLLTTMGSAILCGVISALAVLVIGVRQVGLLILSAYRNWLE